MSIIGGPQGSSGGGGSLGVDIETGEIQDNAVTNAKLANVNTATFKGRTAVGTGDPEDLTVTQATALLNEFVGDTGTGGTKGLVPAPAAGDATKFLRGDKTYQSIPGGGDALTTDPLSQFAATTSAQLAGVLSDETGSGAAVFADSPTLVTPALGTPSSGTLTNCTGLPQAGTVGLTTADSPEFAAVELSHASQNTLTGSGGDAFVEGKRLFRVDGTDVPVADGGTGASTASDARTNLGLGTMATQGAGAVAITGGSVTGITDITVADGGTGASTAAVARTNLGIDLYRAQYGTGVHGAVTISADTTLTADVYCTTYTVDVTKVLTTAGFIIHATGNVTVNGTIQNNGQAGGAGGNGGVGTAGSPGTPAGTTAAASLAGNSGGGSGGAGDDPNILGGGSAGNGASGGVVALGGSSGTNGGAGGAGAGSAGGGFGAATAATVALVAGFPRYRWSECTAQGLLAPQGGMGGSGGGGGGANATNGGGGGGAGGNGGGTVMIFCGGTLTVGASGVISANGGAGGAGGTGDAGAGGGGGGGGGDGGYVQLVYAALSNGGTIQAAGGAAGAAGTGGANNGVAGSAGAQGTVLKFNTTSQAYE